MDAGLSDRFYLAWPAEHLGGQSSRCHGVMRQQAVFIWPDKTCTVDTNVSVTADSTSDN